MINEIFLVFVLITGFAGSWLFLINLNWSSMIDLDSQQEAFINRDHAILGIVLTIPTTLYLVWWDSTL